MQFAPTKVLDTPFQPTPSPPHSFHQSSLQSPGPHELLRLREGRCCYQYHDQSLHITTQKKVPTSCFRSSANSLQTLQTIYIYNYSYRSCCCPQMLLALVLLLVHIFLLLFLPILLLLLNIATPEPEEQESRWPLSTKATHPQL